jgi:N-acetylglucosaminyldiphosphoundecaprenol N-acetyl-beta-D-mannosaminyltransferase
VPVSFSSIFEPTTPLFGLNFFAGPEKKWHQALVTWLEQPFQHTLFVATPNPEQVLLAEKKPDFAKKLQQADVCIPDGVGIVWASRWLEWRGKSTAVSGRITGVDTLTFLLGKLPAEKIALIGGFTAPPAEKMAWTAGYHDAQNPTAAETEAVTHFLKENKPTVVCVALGAPTQEAWIAEYLPLLNELKVKLVIPVGGAADVLFGKLRRAPGWMRTTHLEWLYRLWQEPWRWRRQMKLWQFWPLVLGQ